MKRFHLLVWALLPCLISACATNSNEPLRPEFLKQGDKVALIAPAYPVPDSMVNVCCELLEQRGLQPVVSQNANKRYPDNPQFNGARYAGTAAERAADFEWAFKDGDIKGIICLTGGYGCIQILPEIDPSVIRDNPKWFVGCSDITSLLMATVSCGVQSIHGEMCLAIARKGLEDENIASTINLLMGEVPQYSIPADSLNIAGKAEGILVGGNMTNIVPVLGTGYDAFAGHDCILFIEETGESMHCIDRQLSAILLHHRDRIKGVIVGDFIGCGDEFAYENVKSMVQDDLKDLGIPVCFGFPAGHGKSNMALIEGARTVLSVTESGSSVEFL